MSGVAIWVGLRSCAINQQGRRGRGHNWQSLGVVISYSIQNHLRTSTLYYPPEEKDKDTNLIIYQTSPHLSPHFI